MQYQWKVAVDPFGLLELLRVKLDVALRPFFGRGCSFLRPPHRIALWLCLGEPVQCPTIKESKQQEIDKYHGLLMNDYQQVFINIKGYYRATVLSTVF